METQPSPHPTTETLRAYAVGELDEAGPRSFVSTLSIAPTVGAR